MLPFSYALKSFHERIIFLLLFLQGMIDKFVTKRSVILVPYEHDESKPVDNLVPWLLSVYCQVLTKVRH